MSPLLWATLADDLLQRLSFTCLGYADDLAIVIRGRFAGIISERTQMALNIVHDWCMIEKLSVNAKKTQIVPFTRKRALQGLKPPVLAGTEIPFAKEVKYLGITFDQKLTWKTHILNTAKKASIALGRCRRMCGKNWGLNPKMTLWLYTRVIRPMVTYGSIVWWPKTQQVGAIRLLSGIQRQACLSATGAMRTTPTAAMQVLLNLPPLHIFVRAEARSVRYRLIQGQPPITQSHGAEHQRLVKELKENPITGMPSDAMAIKYNFNKSYKIVIPDREDWKNGPPVRAETVWYTDGSKTEEGVGTGIYGQKSKKMISVSLTKETTVFQAEVAAIHHCVGEINRHNDNNRSIAIVSDSQATLKALNSIQVNSKLVWDCAQALNDLSQNKKVTLAWVPGHSGHPGNEKADDLAKQGSSTAFVGPEPFCGIAKARVRQANQKWIAEESIRSWEETPGQRQAKQFIKEPSPKFAEDLLRRDRKSVRAVVGMLTGHCRLRKHMSNMGLAEEALCRFCNEEEETPLHVLC